MAYLPINKKIRINEPYEIDWNHQASKELYACFNFDKKATLSLVNAGLNNWVNNSSTIEPVNGELSLKLASTSVSDNEYLVDTDFGSLRYLTSGNSTYNFNPGTISFGFVCDDVTPIDELGVVSWGSSSGNDGLYIYIIGGNLVIACGHWTANTITHSITNGEKYNCIYKADGSGSGALFVNGKKIGVNIIVNSPDISHQRCEIGRIFEGIYGNSLNGSISHVHFFNSTFSDPLCESLSDDPHQIFKPVNDPVYFVPDSTENVLVEIPNNDLTLTSYSPSINIGASVASEIPVHNLQLSSFAPVVSVSDHKIFSVPNHDIIITSYGPTVSVSDNKQITVPAHDLILTSYAPSVSVSDTIAIEIPASNITLSSFSPSIGVSDHKTSLIPNKNISLISFAPSVSIGDQINLVVPNKNIVLTSFSPAVSVTASIDVVIPNADISLTNFAPSVFASDNKYVEISNHDISLVSFAPSVSVGDAVSLDILNRDIVISSFAPSVSIGNNISVNIPAHDLNLQSYPPSVVVSSFVDATIQNTDINLTSYAPLVTIAGAFSTAPERIYTVPAVNRNFVYPAVNRIYTMPKK